MSVKRYAVKCFSDLLCSRGFVSDLHETFNHNGEKRIPVMKGKRAPFIVDGMDSQGGSGAKQEEKRKRHSQGHNVSIAASYPPDRPPPPPYPHSSNPQPYSNYGPETPGLFQPGRPNYVYGIQQPLQFTPTPGIPRPGKPGKG